MSEPTRCATCGHLYESHFWTVNGVREVRGCHRGSCECAEYRSASSPSAAGMTPEREGVDLWLSKPWGWHQNDDLVVTGTNVASGDRVMVSDREYRALLHAVNERDAMRAELSRLRAAQQEGAS